VSTESALEKVALSVRLIGSERGLSRDPGSSRRLTDRGVFHAPTAGDGAAAVGFNEKISEAVDKAARIGRRAIRSYNRNGTSLGRTGMRSALEPLREAFAGIAGPLSAQGARLYATLTRKAFENAFGGLFDEIVGSLRTNVIVSLQQAVQTRMAQGEYVCNDATIIAGKLDVLFRNEADFWRRGK
jgi:hypothetical protein